MEDEEDGTDEEYSEVLDINIYAATNIDSPLAMMEGCVGTYRVIAWVDPHDEYWADISSVVRLSNPEWNRWFRLIFDEPRKSNVLKLEVIRIGFLSDIGTSIGETVLGRARIPLPTDFNTRRWSIVELVRFVGPGCKLEGEIELGMELKKMRIQSSSSSDFNT